MCTTKPHPSDPLDAASLLAQHAPPEIAMAEYENVAETHRDTEIGGALSGDHCIAIELSLSLVNKRISLFIKVSEWEMTKGAHDYTRRLWIDKRIGSALGMLDRLADLNPERFLLTFPTQKKKLIYEQPRFFKILNKFNGRSLDLSYLNLHSVDELELNNITRNLIQQAH